MVNLMPSICNGGIFILFVYFSLYLFIYMYLFIYLFFVSACQNNAELNGMIHDYIALQRIEFMHCTALGTLHWVSLKSHGWIKGNLLHFGSACVSYLCLYWFHNKCTIKSIYACVWCFISVYAYETHFFLKIIVLNWRNLRNVTRKTLDSTAQIVWGDKT